MAKRSRIKVVVVVSIYLIVAYLVTLQLVKASPQQLPASNKKSFNEFDELRISNNQLAVDVSGGGGGRSTSLAASVRPSQDGHSRSTGGGSGDSSGGSSSSSSNREGGQVEQRITNHIGKPLVPLPAYLAAQRSNHYQQQQQPLLSHPAYPASAQVANSSLLFGGSQTNINTAHQQQQQQYGNLCSWMSLREFKNISLDTNELILRDQSDRATYILTMRAFIKWTDDDYFPLNNMKALPYVDHIPTLEVPDGHDPKNCSFIATSMADKLAEVTSMSSSSSSPSDAIVQRGNSRLNLFMGPPVRFFEEHIKIIVDCGYLILHIQGDGFNLILRSLSFYQYPRAKQWRERLSASLEEMFDQIAQPEHLVFTTKGTKNSPLFTMPLTARYICKRRVILTGNNSIQLVLDRFELQKLMGKLVDGSSAGAQHTVSTSNKLDLDSVPFGGINRHKRNVAAYWEKSICPLNTLVTLVEQCPQTGSRGVPLSSMMLRMHPKGLLNADRWTIASKSSSAPINSFGGIGSYVSSCVLGFQLARYCLRFFKSI